MSQTSQRVSQDRSQIETVRASIRDFFHSIRTKTPRLYSFGLFHCFGAALLMLAMPFVEVEVMGMHALTKPTKFFLSTALVTWTMAYFVPLLNRPKVLARYTWVLMLTLGFENLYILGQAFRGVRSHFNSTDWFGPILFPIMGIVIALFTTHTLIIGIRFWRTRLPALSPGFLAGIRWGIFLFSMFAYEGFVISASFGHVVGGPEISDGIPFLGWKLYHGDLRIAHFFGMHALQVLPLLGAWVFAKKAVAVHVIAVLYGALVLAILIWALMGRGLLG